MSCALVPIDSVQIHFKWQLQWRHGAFFPFCNQTDRYMTFFTIRLRNCFRKPNNLKFSYSRKLNFIHSVNLFTYCILSFSNQTYHYVPFHHVWKIYRKRDSPNSTPEIPLHRASCDCDNVFTRRRPLIKIRWGRREAAWLTSEGWWIISLSCLFKTIEQW